MSVTRCWRPSRAGRSPPAPGGEDHLDRDGRPRARRGVLGDGKRQDMHDDRPVRVGIELGACGCGRLHGLARLGCVDLPSISPPASGNYENRRGESAPSSAPTEPRRRQLHEFPWLRLDVATAGERSPSRFGRFAPATNTNLRQVTLEDAREKALAAEATAVEAEETWDGARKENGSAAVRERCGAPAAGDGREARARGRGRGTVAKVNSPARREGRGR